MGAIKTALQLTCLLSLPNLSACTDSGVQRSADTKPEYFTAKCWGSGGSTTDLRAPFNGAIAVYLLSGRRYAVVFSGLCRPEAGITTDTDETLWVTSAQIDVGPTVRGDFALKGASALSGSEAGKLGRNPQFPEAIFAVRGSVEFAERRPNGIMPLRRVSISASQALPKEMFGYFLYSPSSRIDLIQSYLSDRNLDDRGYVTNVTD